MFRSFEGQFASKPKVGLRGRSKVEESREQVMCSFAVTYVACTLRCL